MERGECEWRLWGTCEGFVAIWHCRNCAVVKTRQECTAGYGAQLKCNVDLTAGS